MTPNNRQELFTLYAANIAAGIDSIAAMELAHLELEYFEGHAIYHDEPPQTEETGLWVAKDKDETHWIFEAKPVRSTDVWDCEEQKASQIIQRWLAVRLVGPMEWTDEPRNILNKGK